MGGPPRTRRRGWTPSPHGWGGLDIPAISATTSAASATTKHAALSPGVATNSILSLKWLHLLLVCGFSTNKEVPVIWSEVAAAPTKEEGLAILSQYLFMGMES